MLDFYVIANNYAGGEAGREKATIWKEVRKFGGQQVGESSSRETEEHRRCWMVGRV